jgi:outer membrane protein, heavy metal efflux system
MPRPTRLALQTAILSGIAIAIAGVTGCVGFEPLPLAPQQTAAGLENRSLADPLLNAFVDANSAAGPSTGQRAAWDLDRLTLAAFYYHPELDVARAQRAVADAMRIGAAARPDIGAALAPGSNTTTSTPSPRILTLTADLTLETANKRGYRTAQAAQLAEAARLNIASVAWQVRSRVRQSYLDL